MASLDDLKKRIVSVKSTQKITKAMKMVAAAKLKRAQENAEKGRPYSEKMNNIILNLSSGISNKENAPKLLSGTGDDKIHLCVVLTSDRGLCGGFNTNIIKKAKAHFEKVKKDGKILKIIPDVESTSLIIHIETWGDGELMITLPKEVIDTDEGSFFILVDGEETVYYSQDESDSRTLIIPFYNGSEIIEIIGTFVIPEFGTIAAIILAVAITSIIVLSAKTRLNIVPKL